MMAQTNLQLRSLVFIAAFSFAAPGTSGQQIFSDVTASSPGLTTGFISFPGDGHGPGLVFTDLNNDGYADLYMMRAGGQTNGLFLNVPDGAGRRFDRLTGMGGVESTRNSNGALAADYDNDGDQDLFVINWDNTNQLFENQLIETGSFQFLDVSALTDPTPGIADDQHGLLRATSLGQNLDKSLTAAWADPDRDGDLDLYVGNHHQFYLSPGLAPGEKPGQRDIFYRNNGDGTFTDQTVPLGLQGYETVTGTHTTPIQDYSSTNAVIWADFNNDQWPDLFVSNKVGGPDDRDMLYINRGADQNGDWLGMSQETYNLPTIFGNKTGGAMGVAVADLENDGDLDIYLTDWSDLSQAPNAGQNDVWINQLSDTGTLDFVHSSQLPGLFSWGTQWEDFDNNGYADVFAATDGGVNDSLYMNGPGGISSVNTAVSAGITETAVGRGAAAADFNRDGLMDLMVINPWVGSGGNGISVLYENVYAGSNHYLVLELIGDHTAAGPEGFFSTRDAVGARAYVYADLDGDGQVEPGEMLIREVVSGSSNAASTSSLGLEFGLGLATQAVVRVVFPSGRVMTFLALADQYLLVDETAFLAGDLNGDGFVGVDDMNLILGSWNQSISLNNLLADPSGDGFVGVDDLNVLLNGWNTGVPPQIGNVIPEPSTLGLLLLAAPALLRYRR